MKIAFKIFLLLAVVGYIAYAVPRFAGQVENRTCEGISIEIIDSIPVPEGFVTEAYVRSVLSRNKLSPEGMKLKNIDLGMIENLMLEESHIERATCLLLATFF